MSQKAKRIARGLYAYRQSIAWWVLMIFVTLVVQIWVFGYSTTLNLPAALTISAFVLVGVDKWNAIRHVWRVPEKFFYFVALAFGSLGILVGMYVFRHKISKLSFQFVLAIVILIQVGLLAWYYADAGVL